MAGSPTASHRQPAVQLQRLSELPTDADETAPPAIADESQAQPTGPSNWRACLIVVASFAIVFTGPGLNFAFGVYQALYDSMALQPDTPFTGASPARIDLIGTLSISLMTIGAPFTIALCKRFSPRTVVCAGGLVFGLANVLASFGTALWHFELTQGFLLGVGTCLSFMPAVTVAPTWFTARRGLAMGIVLSGTGVGGVVWAPALKAALDHLGLRSTLRLTGGLSLAVLTAAGAVLTWEPAMRARIQMEKAARQAVRPEEEEEQQQGEGGATGTRTRRRRRTRTRTAAANLRGLFPLVPWRVARQRKFAAQAVCAVFQTAAYYTPVFFFASYARTLGYSDTAGANFIALSNACNAVGKVAIGFAADRAGRLNTLCLTTLLSAAATLAFWVPSAAGGVGGDGGDGDVLGRSRALFVAFTVFYGIFASAYVSLFPATVVELFGVENFPSVNGVLYMVRGMASLVGTPVGGLLIRSSAAQLLPQSYTNMALFVGVLLFAATVSEFWVRFEAMVNHGKAEWKWKL